jgi:hypothetical protein
MKMVYKLLFAGAFILVAGSLFPSNIITQLGLDLSVLSGYMESFAGLISGFFHMTDLVFLDGTVLTAFTFAMYFVYFWLIYKVFLLIIKMFS